MGQDLYKVGEALADLSDLGQHIKRVCQVRERPGGDSKKICLGYWVTVAQDLYVSSWNSKEKLIQSQNCLLRSPGTVHRS